MKLLIKQEQRKKPAPAGWCPVCWHRYCRAIPLQGGECKMHTQWDKLNNL